MPYIIILFSLFCKVCLNLMFASDFTSIFQGHLQKWLKHMMTAFLISPPYPTKQININLCYRKATKIEVCEAKFPLVVKNDILWLEKPNKSNLFILQAHWKTFIFNEHDLVYNASILNHSWIKSLWYILFDLCFPIRLCIKIIFYGITVQ